MCNCVILKNTDNIKGMTYRLYVVCFHLIMRIGNFSSKEKNKIKKENTGTPPSFFLPKYNT